MFLHVAQLRCTAETDFFLFWLEGFSVMYLRHAQLDFYMDFTGKFTLIQLHFLYGYVQLVYISTKPER